MTDNAASASTPAPAPAWIRDAICWQVYPLGFCGAPRHREDLTGEGYGGAEGENVVHRLPRLVGWLDHLVSLGANVLLLNPIFDSVSHGYDTLEHRRIDPRLGDESDFDALVAACRERGIRVVLDGVFNHISHLHPTARRAVAAGPGTEEGDRIRWSGTSPYGFEGNDDLVEVDLADPVVQDRVVEIMGRWLERGADGWRLDAMYAAGAEAWAPILERVRAAHPEAWILGEVIHGEYPAFAAASRANSITQYELWKAIWSSLRDGNLFELAHALGRHQDFLEQFRTAGAGALPLTFVGNHDTTRIASQLADGRDLAAAIGLLALLPGIPALYAGDEFGAAALKEERAGGDDAIRPWFPDSPDDVAAAASAGQSAPGGPHPLELLKPEASGRILEVHQRLFSLRRRERWLATASVRVDEDSLENTWAQIVLTPRAGGGGADGAEGADGGDDAAPVPLTLVLNLGDEARPAPGEVLEAVSGADMLDGVGLSESGLVPAHGIAVLR
ncbi:MULTISPECIES: alpha-amylase family glycosyl hydrolase [Brachybacterium]|uniref:alpha-amylase family glycosyl hydrolase n=1 Tax=Brachybacterium TaxID=43668 RepID=UPI000DF16D55|nr:MULTISPECIES: alpha-amylase family glycosyl hydrolase [Brachybacterium]RCS60658.1 glycosidase [Brachybacterium sp. JB7]RCS74694.1 glycosidase [Brachybacterium alimentarium]RCS83522.1 glycosidase [Brachybacterium alimentarium]